jgi:hypothetical protein
MLLYKIQAVVYFGGVTNPDYITSKFRVEAGLNTSTVALRVVGGDEKGTQCLGYNWATLFLGDLVLQVGGWAQG